MIFEKIVKRCHLFKQLKNSKTGLCFRARCSLRHLTATGDTTAPSSSGSLILRLLATPLMGLDVVAHS